MKQISIIYSSRTGNTKKLADAIKNAIPGSVLLEASKVNPDAIPEGRVILGFWIDKGNADADSLIILNSLRNRDVDFFFTLGADSESDYASSIEAKIRSALEAGGNRVCRTFKCTGEVDPELRKKRRLSNGESENICLAEERPNKSDIEAAKKVFSQ